MRGFGFVAALLLLASGFVPDGTAVVVPAMIHLPAGSFDYRPAGEFRIGTRMVDAPVQTLAAPGLDVMANQVSEADYARCMADGGCAVVPTQGRAHYAKTGVNHADATAYAVWFSGVTKQNWRLPSDAEWLRAAGDRAADDALTSDSDPSDRWLAAYRREVALRGEADFSAHPLGHFGRNDLGFADIAGNIWEWTETCFQNGTLSLDGQVIADTASYCGVRAVQGRHRAFVIDFIRDARSGGCGAGVPPDFLGFRLVRDLY